MLKFSYYIDDKIDKAWFDSSDIMYAECDESDTALKTVRVVFKKGGTQYQYEKVPVNEWVRFKNADSQGRSFNEIFRKGGYDFTKLDNRDVEALNEEYIFRSSDGYTLQIDGSQIFIKNTKDESYVWTSDNDDEAAVKILADEIENFMEYLGQTVKRI